MGQLEPDISRVCIIPISLYNEINFPREVSRSRMQLNQLILHCKT